MCTRILVMLVMLLSAGTAVAQSPLAPVDTSSPRATMESFLEVTEEVHRRYSAYRASPSLATYHALDRAAEKAVRLLDLSQIPPVARREISRETFLLLWTVIARLELPDPAEIPDAYAVMEGKVKSKHPTRWRIPGTEITIAPVEEGPRAGEFLFSPDTVRRVRNFYEITMDLPNLRPVPTENLLKTAQILTGWMIPMAWVEALPDWANTAVFGQVLWKWFALLLLFGIAIGAVIGVFRWSRRRPRDGSLRSFFRYLSTPLSIGVFAGLLRYLARHQINVTGNAAAVPDYLIEIAYSLAVIWLIWLSANQIALAVVASSRIRPGSPDSHLVRLAARTIGIGAILVFIFRIAHDIGIPVYGLVAGAGVGGLAVALAARATLENFMGTLNLFADRPVRVGDLCRYDEETTEGWHPVGRVESIGLRSTRIRRLDNTLITIPNAEFAQKHIANLSLCDRFLLSTTLGLRYETTDDQLRFLLAELRELLHAHPKTIHTEADPIRVRFVGYGDYCLNVAIRVYIITSDYNDFLAIQEDILLRIMAVVKQAGTGFAFPSRTMYLTRDSGLNDERQQAAEKQVREWTTAQTLPFPDLDEEHRRQITDTLDYPPEGSPGSNA